MVETIQELQDREEETFRNLLKNAIHEVVMATRNLEAAQKMLTAKKQVLKGLSFTPSNIAEILK